MTENLDFYNKFYKYFGFFMYYFPNLKLSYLILIKIVLIKTNCLG